MAATLGNLSMAGAVLISVVAILFAFAGLRLRSERMARLSGWLIGGIFVMLSITSGALLHALVTSNFRLEYVTEYTERALPIGYKIAAFWAGQAGSLLLWGWILALLSTIAVIGFRKWVGADRTIAILVLVVVNGFFAALLLFAANPFVEFIGQIPLDGRGLNPMLQDPGMIAHPPLLFMGYAGFTIPFAVMFGVLLAGRIDNRWLVLIRRWTLFSWLFLTAGIILGAWWAYIELGWGGYWAWDPVENASLLPWLTATALLHSMMGQQHRGMFKRWNVALVATTFILCIFGTFITRSGVIDSVHAFAPSLIGSFFLVFLFIITLSSVVLFSWKFRAMRPEHEMNGLVSREGAFLAVNLLFVIMMVTTLIGTIFPLLSSWVGMDPITVKPAFYNKVVAPMGLLLALVMAFGPVLPWGRIKATQVMNNLVIPIVLALFAVLIALLMGLHNGWELLCVFIAVMGTLAVIVEFAKSVSSRRKNTGENWLVTGVRLIDRDHRRYGGQLAHLGMMLLIIGISASQLFVMKEDIVLKPGESQQIGGYSVQLNSISQVQGVNYEAVQASLSLTDASGQTRLMTPQMRFYDGWEDQLNSQISLLTNWKSDVYLVLAGWTDSGTSATLQVHLNPAVLWIWIGGIVMTIGGLFCMLPRLLPAGAHQHQEQRGTSADYHAQSGAIAGVHRRGAAWLHLLVLLAVIFVLFVLFGHGIAFAQDGTGGNKFPLPPASDTGVNEPLIDSQTGLPLAAGSLAIQAVQGTLGAAKVGAEEVEIDLIQDGQIIDHIETQLDEFGVLVLRDLPIAGGIIPLVRVHYGEVKYQQPGEMMDPAHPQQRVRVTCYETTEEKPAWTMTTRNIMATQKGSGLFVSEFVVVNNPSDRTWLGDGHGEAGSETRRTVVFSISEDAKEVYLGTGFLKRASVVEPGLIASRLPLMPGENEFKFEYHFHADANGEVEFAIPQSAPVDQLMVVLPSGVQVESSEGIAFDQDMAMGGGPSVGVYDAAKLQAGQTVTMQLGGISGTNGEMGGANLATSGPIVSRSSGMGVKLIAGFGGAVLLLIGIAFILMKSPKEAVEGDK